MGRPHRCYYDQRTFVLHCFGNCPPYKNKRWEGYALRFVQLIWNASSIHAWGSGSRLTYFGIWWHNLDANRSTSTGPIILYQFRKYWIVWYPLTWRIFHSLEALSALVLGSKVPGRYSAVSVIWLVKENFHIFFVSWIMSRFLVSPIFTKKANAAWLSIYTWTATSFLYLQNVNFAALSSSIFICNTCSVWDHLLLLMSSDKKPPDLTESKFVPGKKLLTSHLAVLGLIFISLVPLWRRDIEYLYCFNLFSNKCYDFIVSAVTSCIVVQEELLMFLMIMFP